MDLAVAIRVDEQMDLVGLDIAEHGERAYHYDPTPDVAAPPTVPAAAVRPDLQRLERAARGLPRMSRH